MREKGQVNKMSQGKPYVDMPQIGQLFKKNGVYDGKVFLSQDKVTYTFVDELEVISLHFDRTKGAIFYKGHNISNIDLNEKQFLHLEQFHTVLLQRKDTADLWAKNYQDVLYLQVKKRALKKEP